MEGSTNSVDIVREEIGYCCGGFSGFRGKKFQFGALPSFPAEQKGKVFFAF